jgi:membrane-bound serine protease (ClpP class)
MHRFCLPQFCVYIILLCAGFFLYSAQPSFSIDQNKVQFIELNDDTINPVTAEYIIESIDRAHDQGVQCLIIKLDTPGGLLSSTRTIVKKMLSAQVPIVVYIAPNGSRAGSAGVFITYASHIAAMAPSTNIGAAHPVQMGMKAPRRPTQWNELKELIDDLKGAKGIKKDGAGDQENDGAEDLNEENLEDDDDPMSSKILEDTVAFIKAIAHERNRNVEWAVESVVKSKSITSEEALEKGVVDLIANSDEDLLNQLDGRIVNIDGKEITLQTKEAFIDRIGMDSKQRFFNVLANPNIAYFLMILGFYGLLFEVTHPGFGVPGVLGVAFLILAFYSMQTLPTNYAGLALMILGIILLATEVFTPTFGVLTLGGLTCLILGSMLLFDSVDPIMRVSRSLIYSFTLATGAITSFLVYSVMRSQRAKVTSGKEGLIGQIAETRKPISPKRKGKVFVHGEIWNAMSNDIINEGENATIVEVNGLTLTVERSKRRSNP